MEKRVSKEIWKEFIDKFSSYEGTVTKFYKENNISKSQFYYHKRSFEEASELTFYAISFDEEKAADTERDSTKDIKIEIGKALFVFSNKQMNKLKILHFDEGFWLYYYRLENNKFKPITLVNNCFLQ